MLLMKTSIVFVFSTLLLAGCQTTPSTKTATAVKEVKQSEQVAESKKGEYRCKTETTVGTRFGKKPAEVQHKLNMTAKKQKKV